MVTFHTRRIPEMTKTRIERSKVRARNHLRPSNEYDKLTKAGYEGERSRAKYSRSVRSTIFGRACMGALASETLPVLW